MIEHRYILEPYRGMNTRYRCPSCQQRDKTFSLYIDVETGEHIHPTVGRCNRESNCGYHYTPRQYFHDNNISFDLLLPRINKPRPVSFQPKPVSFIPVEVFKDSLEAYNTNHFVTFLVNLFGFEITSELISKYFIATSKYWNGATIFWQIDTLGKIRTGKIMLYSPTTGKRVKEPFNHITWVHKTLKQSEFELQQCLFGEHLIINETKPIAIVESEKTAVIASVYLPQFVWLAVGSLTNLSFEKCSILKGRTVILFPDLKGYEKWSIKAKELDDLAKFSVSDLLERKARDAERNQGFDLADYLIKFNYKEFSLTEPEDIEPIAATPLFIGKNVFKQPIPVYNISKVEQPKSESWDKDIIELENYFKGIELPTHPVKINDYSTIIDCFQFVENHLSVIKAKNGKKTYESYLRQLKELKNILNNKITLDGTDI